MIVQVRNRTLLLIGLGLGKRIFHDLGKMHKFDEMGRRGRGNNRQGLYYFNYFQTQSTYLQSQWVYMGHSQLKCSISVGVK